jgi:hypothetical protein
MTKFKPGDRVRVYLSPDFKGRVYKAEDETVHVIEDETEDMYELHPQQCRKLKPKQKPEAVKRERAERWLNLYRDHQASDTYFEEDIAKSYGSKENYVGTVHLVELREGEVIIDREKFTHAFAQAYCTPKHSHKILDPELGLSIAARLGLPLEEKK